jgi:hypothetical protein
LAIFEKHGGVGACPPAFDMARGVRSVILGQTEDLAARRGPDAAGASGGDAQSGAGVQGMEWFEPAILPEPNAAGLGEPEPVLAIGGQPAGHHAGQAVAGPEAGNLTVANAAGGTVRVGDPRRSVASVGQPQRPEIRQAVGQGVAGSVRGAEAQDDPALERQPEGIVGRLADGPDHLVGDAGRKGQGHPAEPDTVETCQAVEGGHPEVTIAVLGDAGHVVVRQAFVRLPGTSEPVWVRLPLDAHAGREQGDAAAQSQTSTTGHRNGHGWMVERFAAGRSTLLLRPQVRSGASWIGSTACNSTIRLSSTSTSIR